MRYSSWSIRAWLAVHLAGLDMEEVASPRRSDKNSTLV